MDINEFILDSFSQITPKIGLLGIRNQMSTVKHIIFINPDHPMAYMMMGAVSFFYRKFPESSLHVVTDQATSFPSYLNMEDFTVWDSLDAIQKNLGNLRENTLVFYFTNFRSGLYQQSEEQIHRVDHFRASLEWFVPQPEVTFTFVPFLPPLEALPACCNAVAEREIEVLWKDKPAGSPERMMLDMEEMCRCMIHSHVTSPRDFGHFKIKVARIDSVFGPGVEEEDGCPILPVVREILEKQQITLYNNDCRTFISASYIDDAILSLLLISLQGRCGNIYHVSSFSCSLMDIKSQLLAASSMLQVRMVTAEEENAPVMQYRVLNSKKLLLVHIAKKTSLLHTTIKKSVKYTFLYFYNQPPYLPQEPLNVYYGRIDRIREMELQELDEIDRICRENNIRYILAGGSMLGAIRHKGFIPWDDDVDIAMLPEDYERFLKICPKQLSERYTYQNFDTDLESHYIHDKIRISDTYFSTRYSNRYFMANGVYVDIFVYYKTSDRPFMQKIHLNLIRIWRRVIGIRWADRPRKGYHYTASKILLPIMRIVPFRWYHLFYKKLLGMYEKRNTHHRIDSGFNLMKCGAFPAEWFDETIEVDFCGHKYPIPARYDEYLRHWYGNHYMELLPISSRTSVHDVIRIDLGRYLTPETENGNFHHADLRGELYESPLQGNDNK